MNTAWFVVLLNLTPAHSVITDKVLTNGTNDMQECVRTAMITQAQLQAMHADKEYTALCKKLTRI